MSLEGFITLLLVFAVVAVLGYLLNKLSLSKGNSEDSVIDAINELLPQTQCAQCGYPGCRPYATAIANADAPINLCPPGGTATIEGLAKLLDKKVLALEPSVGEKKPPAVAVINEAECIGCVLCIQACPVDAIVGAAKYMHTVIEQDCTGCELCIAPCPVDCIDMVELPQTLADWRPAKPGL